mgnify:CR=1 FL=1
MFAVGIASLKADHRAVTLAVTMTNDPATNQIKVYDVSSRALIQTLSTRGKGGAGGNAEGVRQYRGEIVAVVNNGSNTVALYKRDGSGLRFDKLVTTTSAPVSIDFANDHMPVGRGDDGRFVRDSSRQRGMARWHRVAGAGDRRRATSGQHGASRRHRRAAAARHPESRSGSRHRRRGPAPRRSDRRRGSCRRDGSRRHAHAVRLLRVSGRHRRVITLAHSSQAGLFRDGGFTSVIDATQAADCWSTRAGKVQSLPPTPAARPSAAWSAPGTTSSWTRR